MSRAMWWHPQYEMRFGQTLQRFGYQNCKPDGLRRISRKNLISKFTRVKYSSVYEFTA
jgi:hypothetical protein